MLNIIKFEIRNSKSETNPNDQIRESKTKSLDDLVWII
jgi:hypothetical protein